MSPRDPSSTTQSTSASRLVYSRDELLALRIDPPSSPASFISVSLRRRRGCRSGLHVYRRQLPASCRVSTRVCSGEIPTIIGNRRKMSTNAVNNSTALRFIHDTDCSKNVTEPRPALKKIRICRHTVSSSHQLTFGLLNVQSANNKIDDIIDMKKEQGLDVMLLTETWHDTDSVSIRRLRAEGLAVCNSLTI
jgi:hypothetical protein